MIENKKSLDDYWDKWRCPRCGVILDRSETYCWNCKFGLKRSRGGGIIRFIDICAKVILIIVSIPFVVCFLLIPFTMTENTDIDSISNLNSEYAANAYTNSLDVQLETSRVENDLSINGLSTALETEAAVSNSTLYEVVDLTKMLEEHKENPFRAEALYLNKYVEIKGCIAEFQKYRIDSPYDHVCLYDGISDKFRYIYGLATDNIKTELVNYSKGDFVVMRGKVVRVETVGYQILIDSLEKCE